MSTLGSFVWSIADQLRGVYRPNQYGGVVLPFAILRRLDCLMAPTRDEVRELAEKYEGAGLAARVKRRERSSGTTRHTRSDDPPRRHPFLCRTSELTEAAAANRCIQA